MVPGRDAAADACPLCGYPMEGYQCRLVCPNCGYREDCSDAFTAGPIQAPIEDQEPSPRPPSADPAPSPQPQQKGD